MRNYSCTISAALSLLILLGAIVSARQHRRNTMTAQVQPGGTVPSTSKHFVFGARAHPVFRIAQNISNPTDSETNRENDSKASSQSPSREREETSPILREFDGWVEEYLSASSAEAKAALEARGEALARTRRYRRSSFRLRASIRPADVSTAIPASTPTRSVGRRRRSRCRWCAIRGWFST